MRRIPSRSEPVEGEQLYGWLIRTAASLDVSPTDVVASLDSTTTVRSQLARHAKTGAFPDAVVEAFDLSHDQVHGMTLASLAPFACAGPEDAIRSWVYRIGSHFCPACLEEAPGVWPLRWKLGWSHSCIRHGSILAHRCPACGRRAGLETRALTITKSHLRLPANTCRQPGSGTRPCGFDLTQTQTAAAAEEVIVSQRQVEDAYRNHNSTMAGFDVASSTYLDTLARLSNIVLQHARSLETIPPTLHLRRLADACNVDHSTIRSLRAEPWRPRTDTATVAWLASFATHALAAPDPSELTERMEGVSIPPSRHECGRATRGHQISGLAQPIADAVLGGTHHLRAHPSKLLVGANNPDSPLGVDHIPQAVPTDLLPTRFRKLLESAQPITFAQMRMFASLTAATIATRQGWRRSAEALGVHWNPDTFVQPTIIELEKNGTAERFRRYSEQLLQQYATTETPYGQRRRRWSNLTTLPDHLTQLAEPAVDADWLASQVWAHLTGGIAELAPVWRKASHPPLDPPPAPTPAERDHINTISAQLEALGADPEGTQPPSPPAAPQPAGQDEQERTDTIG
jgi:hypothetical protein